MTTPRLTIVVVGFDMERELPRTVISLLPPYQRGITHDDVEVVVVDNGSSTPIRKEWFPPEATITVTRLNDGGVSPCKAINHGASLARADHLAIVVDGARMASPGLVDTALSACGTHARSFVATLGFHLGPDVQQKSIAEGYSREREEELLRRLDWLRNGYALFGACALGESYLEGVLKVPPETTFCLMQTALFHDIGGYDERFVTLGGGLAGFDFFRRAVEACGDAFFLLIGEGTFHQLHHGATTQAGGVGRPYEQGLSLWDVYMQEYERIVGTPYNCVTQTPLLFGRITHPEVPRLFFGRS